MQHLVAVSHTVCICKKFQKFGDTGVPPLSMGKVADPLETCFSPPVLPCQFCHSGWNHIHI